MAPINTISRSVRFGLQCAAAWPDTSFSILLKFVWVILLSVVNSYLLSYLIAHFRSYSLMETMDSVSICLTIFIVCAKLFIAWTHHSLLRKILTTMEEECEKYAVIDTNNLIPKTAHLSYRLTTAILCMYVIASTCYTIGTLTHQAINTEKHRELVLKMDLPFDTSRSPIYEIVIIVQYSFQVLASFAFSVFSAFLLMIVLHVGCQIDIMCQTLTESTYTTEKKLKFFINRHQEIITFSEKIEQFFSYIALSQFVSNTIVICGLGYVIVITLNVTNASGMLIKCVMFYISICIEAFIYAFAGEYLSTKSKLIADTAYECLWYDLQPYESRLLIPVILRSQRGFTLTCGKFANLSMESYSNMMKASASYISVLLAMT